MLALNSTHCEQNGMCTHLQTPCLSIGYALFVFRMLTNNDIVDFVNAEAAFFARDRFPSLSM